MNDKLVKIESADWYQSLVDDCKAIITEAVFTSRWALVEGYHALGERVITEENLTKRAIYGLEIVQDLAQSIGINKRTLHYAIQFYRKYPDLSKVPEGKNISWNKLVTKYLPAPKEPEKPLDDEVLESQSKWKVKRGEVWTLGRHLVLCGDSYEAEEIAGVVGEKTIQALITDPPYGIGYTPDWNKWDGSPSDFRKVVGDDEEFNPGPFLDYPTVVMFGANYFSNRLPIGGWICWDKRLDENKDQMFGSPFELAWFRSTNTAKKAFMVRVLHGGVVNADSAEGNNEKRLHTTQKPVDVMQSILESLTMPGDTVLDPFAGSGSTLLACENTERGCVAVEIEPNYVAVILDRWHRKMGEKPCKV